MCSLLWNVKQKSANMNDYSNENEVDIELIPWEPQGLLRQVDRRHVALSRGFLRSRPERWVPNLTVFWLPIIDSVGAEIRVVEVKPVSAVPQLNGSGVMLAIGGHHLVVTADGSSKASFLEAFVPDVGQKAQGLLLEYLARRFVGSLALSWRGEGSSEVRVFGGMDISSHEYGGAVKVMFLVNGQQVSLWLLLSTSLVDELDRLWRLQLHSTNRLSALPVTMAIEVAQLAVPPEALRDYLRTGQAVDLDIPMSDSVVLRFDDNSLISARICDVESRLGCEILSSRTSGPSFPEGFERFSVVLGGITCEPTLLAEISQMGAMLETGMPLGDRVELWVNGNKEGRGVLRSYRGRFAVEVD